MARSHGKWNKHQDYRAWVVIRLRVCARDLVGVLSNFVPCSYSMSQQCCRRFLPTLQYPTFDIDHSRKNHNIIMLFVYHPKILHKYCFQFLLGVKMARRESENNAYAKFLGDKQRILWYVMVFSGVVNTHTSKFLQDSQASVRDKTQHFSRLHCLAIPRKDLKPKLNER